MSPDLLEQMVEEWARRKPSVNGVPEGEDADTVKKALSEFLQRCVDAGRSVARPAERRQLQRLARDVADTVFRFSDDPYPDAVIKAAADDDTDQATNYVDRRVPVFSWLPVTGEHFVGRESELQTLRKAWGNPAVNVLSIVAWAGAGKSALVNHWLGDMAAREFDGARRVFGWSFAGQGVEDGGILATNFFNEALRRFGAGRTAQVFMNAEGMGEQLAEWICSERTLLVLDGLEAVQFPPDRENGYVRDIAIRTLLRRLAEQNPGLCVVTSRQPIAELAPYRQSTVQQISLDNLTSDAGSELLRGLGVEGSVEDLQAAVDEYGGHALTLTLLGGGLRDLYAGDVKRRRDLDLIGTDLEAAEQAKRFMAGYDQRFRETPEGNVLRLLGLFYKEAEPEEIDVLRRAPPIGGLTDRLERLTPKEWHSTLLRLRRLGLLPSERESMPGGLDAHALVRAYFAHRAQEDYPDAWSAGHRRLFEHHMRVAPETPTSAEEMAPLFEAGFHGCKANEHVRVLHEVLLPRILQVHHHSRFVSTNTLGLWAETLSLIRLLFKDPWVAVQDGFKEPETAFVFTSAGACLRALFRFPEAIRATRQGLELHLEHQRWSEAAFAYRMLNQTHIAAGQLREAQDCGRRSVTFADRGTNLEHRVCARARYGESLHHGGKTRDAASLFQEAFAIWNDAHASQEPALLDGFSEFEYCDLLIALGRESEARDRATRVVQREESKERAQEGSEAYKRRQPLWEGLGHLILGRIDFIEGHQASATGSGSELFSRSLEHFNTAVDNLENADEQQHRPLGYLARARVCCEEGRLVEADADLGLVLKLTSSGGMNLHLTDYHLVSVRCALRRDKGEAARDHLERARTLIKRTGSRRNRELDKLERLAAQ